MDEPKKSPTQPKSEKPALEYPKGVRVPTRKERKAAARLLRQQEEDFRRGQGKRMKGHTHKEGRKSMVPSTGKELVTVAVMEGDKEVARIEDYPVVIEWADALTQVYPWDLDENGFLILRIPRDKVLYRTLSIWERNNKKVTPSMCGYNSTKEYLKHLFGVELDLDDRTFYENHPLLIAEGLPAAHTFRVVSELVEPYGFRIARVQMAPGTSVPETLAVWQKYLGVNPLALVDRTTTNAEFAEQSGLSLAECRKMFRFEFSDIPLRPSVSCESSFQFKKEDSKDFWVGGHASYRSPRSKLSVTDLSFQLSRLEHDPWPDGLTPTFPELPPSPVEEEERAIDLWKMWINIPKDERDKLLPPFSGKILVRPGAFKGKTTELTPTKPSYMGMSVYNPPANSDTPKHTNVIVTHQPHICCACGGLKDKMTLSGPFCYDCWCSLFYGMYCQQPKHGTKARTDGVTELCGAVWASDLPLYRGFDRTRAELYFTCTECDTKHYFTSNNHETRWFYQLAYTSLIFSLTTWERARFRKEREDRLKLLYDEWERADIANPLAALKGGNDRKTQPLSPSTSPGSSEIRGI